MRVAETHFCGRVNAAARALLDHAMASGGRRASRSQLWSGDSSSSEGSELSDEDDDGAASEWSGLVAGAERVRRQTEHDLTLFTLQIGTVQCEWLCACAELDANDGVLKATQSRKRAALAMEPVVKNAGVDVVMSRILASYERMDRKKLLALLQKLSTAESDRPVNVSAAASGTVAMP